MLRRIEGDSKCLIEQNLCIDLCIKRVAVTLLGSLKNEKGGSGNLWAICKNLRLTQHVELGAQISETFIFCVTTQVVTSHRSHRLG